MQDGSDSKTRIQRRWIWLAIAVLALVEFSRFAGSAPGAVGPAARPDTENTEFSKSIHELRLELAALRREIETQPASRDIDVQAESKLRARITALEQHRHPPQRITGTEPATGSSETELAARVFAVEREITREGEARLKFQSDLMGRVHNLETRQSNEEVARIDGLHRAHERLDQAEQRLVLGETRQVSMEKSLGERSR